MSSEYTYETVTDAKSPPDWVCSNLDCRAAEPASDPRSLRCPVCGTAMFPAPYARAIRRVEADVRGSAA